MIRRDPHELPTKLRPLVDASPQVGRVDAIFVRPGRGMPTRDVAEWDLDSAADHGKRDGDRGVTLIQAEHVPAIAALLGRPVAANLLRRNLVVSGINLRALLHGRFAVGDAILEGTAPCDPCDHMEANLGPGGLFAMIGMGGICARIERRGVLRVGDPVRWLG